MHSRHERVRRAPAVDAAIAAALLAVALVAAPVLDVTPGTRQPVDALGYALMALAIVPIVTRRAFPLISFAITVGAIAGYLIGGFAYGPIFLPLAVVAYTLGRHIPLVPALVAALAGYGAILAHLLVRHAVLPGLLGLLPAAAWIVVPLTIGIARRLVLEARAREQVQLERRLIDDERLRLAGEVHDVVGHGLAAIQMQADIALHVGATDGERTRHALQSISEASAAALSELRATIARIAPDEADSRVPTPGLASINGLVARMGRAGLDARLSVRGTVRQATPSTDLVGYRIVQESLTNAVKHSRSKIARVEVTYADAEVRLEIVSPHDGSGDVAEGFGIAGMRRRAEDAGGDLSVSAEGGSFTVCATLPLAAKAP